MIYQFDIKYFLTQIHVNTIFRLNFRKIVYVGRENIPAGKPIIYAPTHRNALVDALVLVDENIKRQVVFLARADIFKKPFVAKILHFLRIMPVYRIRDGKENLSKNEEIFENCEKILKNGNPICLFPEAVHNPHQNLLPLQKAIPRIALPTEAHNGFGLDTHIVPVAFHYKEIHGFLSDLYVTYGEPVKVTKYKELYEKDENQAINKLRHDLDARLREYVVDVPDEDYDEISALIDVNAKELAKEYFPKKDGIVHASQEIIRKLNDLKHNNAEEYSRKISSVKSAIDILKKNGLTTKDPIAKPENWIQIFIRAIFIIATFPVAFAGLLNTVFPIIIYRKLLNMFNDKQFISSVRIVTGIFVVPLFYFLQALTVELMSGSFKKGILYLIISPIVFYLGCYWRKGAKKTLQLEKVWFFRREGKGRKYKTVMNNFKI